MRELTHVQLKKVALKRPGVKKAYNTLDEEFNLLETMIKARLKLKEI